MITAKVVLLLSVVPIEPIRSKLPLTLCLVDANDLLLIWAESVTSYDSERDKSLLNKHLHVSALPLVFIQSCGLKSFTSYCFLTFILRSFVSGVGNISSPFNTSLSSTA